MLLANVVEKTVEAIKYISNNAPLVWKQTEWAICGRLQCSLINRFPDYDIDIELKKDDGRRPDIVIHKLGNNKNNLVAIEVKKDPSKKDVTEDLNKITERYFEKPYLYRYGIFVSIGRLPKGLPQYDRSRIKLIQVYGWEEESQPNV